MTPPHWEGRPYYSLDAWCKEHLHRKCYKVALNAHMTCPNRDGTLGVRGCIFCSAGGSGDFAEDFTVNAADDVSAAAEDDAITAQLSDGYRLIRSKLPQDDGLPRIIAYFQAYTNTYAPVSRLRALFSSALRSPLVCGISIATRPDCLPEEVLRLLTELKEAFPDKFIWVELGLQTIHEKTADFIRRGYPLSCFDAAVKALRQRNIPVIVHVILGLPGETRQAMLETVRYVNGLAPFGIKLQLLHVLRGTDLADYYLSGGFEALTKQQYLDILTECLENLSPQIVIHRVTGDGSKRLLLAPLWSGNKKDVLNSLHRQMKLQGSYQGKQLPQTAAEGEELCYRIH